MDISLVESILINSNNKNWSLKGDRLSFRDGNTRFLFDKIEDRFFAFRKMILVSDGRLIKIPFFRRIALHKQVIKRCSEINQHGPYSMEVVIQKPSIPQNTWIPNHSFETNMWGNLNTEEVKKSQTKTHSCNCSSKNKSDNKTMTDDEQKLQTFKDNVEKEKARIRKLLRKDKG